MLWVKIGLGPYETPKDTEGTSQTSFTSSIFRMAASSRFRIGLGVQQLPGLALGVRLTRVGVGVDGGDGRVIEWAGQWP
jgi:hypothetical protein